MRQFENGRRSWHSPRVKPLDEKNKIIIIENLPDEKSNSIIIENSLLHNDDDSFLSWNYDEEDGHGKAEEA
jgi:hypothetical protein